MAAGDRPAQRARDHRHAGLVVRGALGHRATQGGHTAAHTPREDYQHALRLQSLVYTAAGDALFERPAPQVLLVHANAVGAAQWDALFTWMKGRGFRFATADEVLADPALAEAPAFLGRYGGSVWDRIRHVRRQAKAREQIAKLLEQQAADWNRGDLAAFTSVYDEDAVFVSPTGVTRGRAAVLDRYRKRYPDQASMGALGLEIVEVRDVWGPEVTPLGDATPGGVHGASVGGAMVAPPGGRPIVLGTHADRAAAVGKRLADRPRRVHVIRRPR